MATWNEMLPDFKIVRWDESTFDVNSTPFTKEAYRLGKYAFVADYVRLYALTNYGGLYLDTDVEIIKQIDCLFERHQAVGGFETPNVLQTGVLACEKGNHIFEEFFSYYKSHVFIVGGENATPPNSAVLRDIMKTKGLLLNNSFQVIDNFAIYPQEFFCPIDQGSRQIIVTANTYCIHYLSGSWFDRRLRWTNNVKRIIGNVLGYNTVNYIRRIFNGMVCQSIAL